MFLVCSQPHLKLDIWRLFTLFSACLLCLACICSYMDATSSRGRAPGSTTISYLNSLYRDVFLICTSFMTAVVGAMVIHLILRSSHIVPHHVDASPGILLVVSIGLLICPFNIFYRSTHYCFLQVIRSIACSPFYKVVLVDFFMADRLTSQCARRWFDDGENDHLANMGKYVSTMLAAGARLTFAMQPEGRL